MKSSLYRNLFALIALIVAACSQKPAVSEKDLADLVFIGAGETKIIDRHGRCIAFQDLTVGHDGYYLPANKEIWLALEPGERKNEHGDVVMRMAACL